MRIDQSSPEQLSSLEAELSSKYAEIQARKLNLDITRGKPNAEQLALSDALDGILAGSYKSQDGTDTRNYGGLDGLPAAKALFAEVIGVEPGEVLIGGNASLSLMYQAVLFAHFFGVSGPESAWALEGEGVAFLCPVPGYDRHFSICEQLGIEMINVAMTPDGPDMDQVEALVASNPMIKGIWCVPRFSNPSGIVYSDAVVERIAKLPKIAGKNFRVMWDNAYAVHTIASDAPVLSSIADKAKALGTFDNIYIFSSTSKITFAGAGVSFLGTSAANLKAFQKQLGISTIGPDKVNQERHVRFLKDQAGILAHMEKHANILAPRFASVLRHLDTNFADSDLGQWTAPKGGYFVSFDTRKGCAKAVVKLAAEAGVKLTPAGATYPYGNDPDDRNIRIAPSFTTVSQLEEAMEVFCLCVKLASVRQALSA